MAPSAALTLAAALLLAIASLYAVAVWLDLLSTKINYLLDEMHANVVVLAEHSLVHEPHPCSHPTLTVKEDGGRTLLVPVRRNVAGRGGICLYYFNAQLELGLGGANGISMDAGGSFHKDGLRSPRDRGDWAFTGGVIGMQNYRVLGADREAAASVQATSYHQRRTELTTSSNSCDMLRKKNGPAFH